jgi:hypothetical protein
MSQCRPWPGHQRRKPQRGRLPLPQLAMGDRGLLHPSRHTPAAPQHAQHAGVDERTGQSLVLQSSNPGRSGLRNRSRRAPSWWGFCFENLSPCVAAWKSRIHTASSNQKQPSSLYFVYKYKYGGQTFFSVGGGLSDKAEIFSQGVVELLSGGMT